MSSTPPDPALCAARLRSAVSQLALQLRGATPDGPSVAQLSVLGQLHRQGPCTPTALAALERVRLQSLTRLLATLEAEGWIDRSAHPSDGRQSLLALTAEGRRRLQVLMRAREAALAAAIATLDAEQQALLMKACALIDGLAASLDGTPQP